jgi:hypothetical protein
VQSFTVEGERIRIGTAAYCEIRLPHGEAAPEQVALEDRGNLGWFAEALSQKPSPTLNGAALSSAKLESGALLEMGATKIVVTIIGNAVQSSTTSTASKQKTNPLLLVAAAVVVPWTAFQLLTDPPDQAMSPPRQAPALFAAENATCPQSQPERARAFGVEQKALADAKRERRPFHAQDGVRAVHLYHVAAACLRLGGDSAGSPEADKAAADLQQDLEESYRTRRMRLEHALSIKDRLVARHEVRALLDVLSGQQGEYVTWLSSLDRRLKLGEGK